jgi:hypothetical protein
LKLALKGRPDYPDALAELGHYYLILRNYVAAERPLQRALKLDPDHLLANFYLLMLYTRTRDPRGQEQSRRYDDLQKQREEKNEELLRMVTVKPFDRPQP